MARRAGGRARARQENIPQMPLRTDADGRGQSDSVLVRGEGEEREREECGLLMAAAPPERADEERGLQ